MKFHIRGGRGGGRRENRSAISRNTWRNFPRGWIPRGASRTNERIRMNACRTMDWLARARNDFIIYLGHDRFQCANRNCLLRRSGGVVNVASSSSRREWQFVSPIKLIASVRDWSRCSDRARSLGTKGVASSPRSSKRMMGWEFKEFEERFDSIRARSISDPLVSFVILEEYMIISRTRFDWFSNWKRSLERYVYVPGGEIQRLSPEISGYSHLMGRNSWDWG